MGKAFTDREKEIIYRKLIEVGSLSIAKSGFKKTSIEDIAKEVGISKGAFYTFFPSKEVFFFKLMEVLEKEVKSEFASVFPKDRSNFKDDIVNNIYEFICSDKIVEIIDIINCGELDNIMKKLPDNEMEKHLNKDREDIVEFFEPVKDMMNLNTLDIEYIMGMVRLIFFSLIHKKQIGVSVIEKVIRTQIKSIVNYIVNI
ncbi:TetR/AcrR family transcriptional regulator [Clostridium vincentii]|uniref:DNA-binding transcriptional repressor AcrR n=1 Tax=Clostridium vincentii TaxID=52704 RepID=A0A2T0BD63_9CLOT|nr:TetR/AcrR family transcriptional regulator [Clostridium vincentii]PRR81836.1 DNA-binding transcriptional repressor AcrR [Clostridium vincentii]